MCDEHKDGGEKGLRSVRTAADAGGQTAGPGPESSRGSKASEGESGERAAMVESDDAARFDPGPEEGGACWQEIEADTGRVGETGNDPASRPREGGFPEWSLDAGSNRATNSGRVSGRLSPRTRVVSTPVEISP